MNSRLRPTLGLVIAIASLIGLANVGFAQPQYDILHAFPGLPGESKAQLLRTADGSLYGLTAVGGRHGGGTIFVLRPLPGSGFSYATLHEFREADGGGPIAGLIQGSDGALYGTTPERGSAGLGTIFKITTTGTFTLLHTFNGADGSRPLASLIQGRDGHFYGTTNAGGAHDRGTVFRMTGAGALTVLHSFAGGEAGAAPDAPVVQAADGHLYGTSRSDSGVLGVGSTVFRLATDGTFVTVHTFPATYFPVIGLVLGPDDYLYGAHRGIVGPLTFFKMTTAGSATDLHTLDSPEGDTTRHAPWLLGPDGRFYGTLPFGGAHQKGTAFALTTEGAFTVLHSFTEAEGASYSGFAEGADGRMYGVTSDGGLAEHGMVFAMEPGGGPPVALHHFTGIAGDTPWAGPIRGFDGALYGTTVRGGVLNLGTVYRLSTTGVFSTLHMFTGPDGAHPYAGLLQGRDGFLYGTTLDGGCSGRGTIFRISLLGAFSLLHCFTPGQGSQPFAPLIQARDGLLYGTTVGGGLFEYGTIFRIAPGGGSFSTLHSFVFNFPAEVSSIFPFAPLLEAADGRFYSTAGGASFLGFTVPGTVYTLTPQAGVTTLGPITASYGGLTASPDGSLYGVSCCNTPQAIGGGSVIRVSAFGPSPLVLFTGENGFMPINPPIVGLDGYGYGTTLGIFGGTGSIYRLTGAGELITLKILTGNEGASPAGRLLAGLDGALYGTAAEGGPARRGVIFRLRPQ
jgi:uncharacterized repeat protein (TIGR03803 family)